MTTVNWPNPERPGVPMFPERDGWHIIKIYDAYYIFRWDTDSKLWWDNQNVYTRPALELADRHVSYIGPALTPAQINEMLAAERERCAKECERLKPSMDEIIGNSFFGVRGVALVDAAAAIRNLGDAP